MNPSLAFVHSLHSLLPDNRHQEAKVPVAIRVLDVNDNAPKFAAPYEGFICESDQTKPLSNQVTLLSPPLAVSSPFGNRVCFESITWIYLSLPKEVSEP